MTALASRRWRWVLLTVAAVAVLGGSPGAEAAGLGEFNVNLNADLKGPQDEKELSGALQILFFFTILSLVPALLLTMTSFTRIIIVLAFVRRALSLQSMPPNQVMIGLALFLTMFTMAPTWEEISGEAIAPYRAGEIASGEALSRSTQSLRKFMLKHTRKRDLALFVHLSKMPRPKGPADVPTHVLIPAFVTSELKTAFQMGFVIFLPFLVIDMVVASVLTSMGMFMLPPVIISVPFKILLFVLVDGWHLILRSMVVSFY